MSMMQHPDVIYSTNTQGPILGTRVFDSELETEASRARRCLAELNLKMRLADELRKELAQVRFNRWYRRLWRYLQAIWWERTL